MKFSTLLLPNHHSWSYGKLSKNNNYLTLSLKLLTLLHISPHMHKCYKLNLLFQSLGFPDKNSGIPDIYCPTILWNDMYNSFYKNINFERRHHLSEECILQHFKHAYESNKWVVFGSFKENGSVPYPYKIRKFKDLSRSRGIISYFHHPSRGIFLKYCQLSHMFESTWFLPE